MYNIHIEMFPAKSGDSFLIRFDNKKNFLIDMGYADTYNTYIKPRLITLKEIEKQDIDLLVITHIDEDHILGAIEFFKKNKYFSNPEIIRISEIWYNSYKHLQFNIKKEEEIGDSEKKILKEISIVNSNKNEKYIQENIGISSEQGSTLAGLLYKYSYSNSCWNSMFDCKAINYDNKRIVEIEDIRIIMLSPSTDELLKLSKKWLSVLKRKKYNFKLSSDALFDDAYEFYIRNLKMEKNKENEMISYSTSKSEFNIDELSSVIPKTLDTSVSNGASISFIIEYKNKKLLFLGDCHDDIITKRLLELKENGYELNFNLVKISHHGSIKNNINWINIISAEYYLISTDGKKHGHPNDEVIAKIINSNKQINKKIVFNYDLDKVKKFNDDDLKKKYNYSIIIADENSSINIEL